MSAVYGRELDLNLLRIFTAVAEASSVTRAARDLYLTQPAVSAALARLTAVVGAKLFTREGRGLVLTARGQQLLAASREHLAPLIDAALAPPTFDPQTSTAVVRVGLFDSSEGWLLTPLLAALRDRAPAMQVIARPVHFRDTEAALLSRTVDVAVTVAGPMPDAIARITLGSTGFSCVFDPAYVRIGKSLTEAKYFEHEHIIVSYAGDLRGIVEDRLGRQRRVRVSVPGFSFLGDLVEGSPLLATMPSPLASHLIATRPHLRALPVPLELTGDSLDLLWLRALDDDPLSGFIRALVREMVEGLGPALRRPPPRHRATRRRA